MSQRHLVIMAAGTGGHIIPGLAVAQEMQQRGWTVSWLGTPAGMEHQLVPPTGIPLDAIGFAGLRGKGLKHTINGARQLMKAFGEAKRILKQRAADAVLGMGGYVCVPGGVMARLARKPLMLVNADASLLLSNRTLLPMADRIGFGFDGEAATRLNNAVVTGNPVRAEIEAIDPPAERFATRQGRLRLLVVGGSLGAKVLNETLPQALALMPPERRPMVTHQTGKAMEASVRAAYAAAGIEAEVLPFITDMPRRLADCDLVVCRAGAVTVSELCVAGVASILVPLIVSTTSHQQDNARFMAQHGAALHLPQQEMTPSSLAALIERQDRFALFTLADKARHLGRPRAAARVADEIEAMVEKKKK